MAQAPSCPDCTAVREAEWEREHARYQVTPVSDIPELVAAWADDTDPATVMVAGGWKLRRFRCPNGHQPQLSPLTYLRSGCPSCRGN